MFIPENYFFCFHLESYMELLHVITLWTPPPPLYWRIFIEYKGHCDGFLHIIDHGQRGHNHSYKHIIIAVKMWYCKMETWNGSMISCITRYVFQSRNIWMKSISKNNPYEGNKQKYQKWKEETIFFFNYNTKFFLYLLLNFYKKKT